MRVSIIALLLGLSVAAAACTSTEGLLGEELYRASCSSCHAGDGSGRSGPAIGAGSDAVALNDEQIAGVINLGPGAMPAIGRSLSAEQVTSLVAYVRELQAGDR